MTITKLLILQLSFCRLIYSLLIPPYGYTSQESFDALISPLENQVTETEGAVDLYVKTINAFGSIENEYIVLFKDSVETAAIESHLDRVRNLLNKFDNPELKFQGKPLLESFNIGDLLQGYIIRVPSVDILVVIQSCSSLIDNIETNSMVKQSKLTIQDDTPWGLTRLSQRTRVYIGQNQTYAYDSNTFGKNVNAYVLDTGILTTHEEFGGRAKWGKTVIFNDLDEDNNGHGTHCAGIIGSTKYGVAKAVNLIAVKVLNSNGNGEMSDVIKGVEYVVNDHIESKRKDKKLKGSTANMSLGAGKSYVLVKAIDAAVKSGVNFAVAAGNEDSDACYTSPSDSQMAITVGATTFSDDRAFFSNWGKCVDIFAPGQNIMSTYIGSNNETRIMSGTSMSAPYVAGLMSYFISLQPEMDSQFYSEVTPEQLKKKIIDFGSYDNIYDPGEFSPNIIAYNGAGKDLTKFWNFG